MSKTLCAFETERGKPHPLGATVTKNGVNFSIFSRFAAKVELLIFNKEIDKEPCFTITLDNEFNKTFNFWHVFVKRLKPCAFYAYRVDGPDDPQNGHRFNRNKLLIDPYGRGLSRKLFSLKDASSQEDNIATSMRSAVVDVDRYDWQEDKPINRPMHHTIIYELHVGAFTKSPSSKVKYQGTFLGVIEKIPYLLELGVTAVELQPVFDFDDTSILPHVKDRKLTDFWGYNPIGFFVPHSSYCVSSSPSERITEFRDMIRALHKAGIGVILDVVFNHTYEGNETGPTYCFRGLDNSIYYHLSQDKSKYADYSGCGNSLSCNHPIVSKFIIDCLRYWVEEMHVDGFRFDLASVMARGEGGDVLKYPPILWTIELSDRLIDTKIIAEAWDAAGLYQVGDFPGFRWAEWNGKYRDDVRKFMRSEEDTVKNFAYRLCGSFDLYADRGQTPTNTINFVTAHDGFTLNDLVSYNEKHNLENGEDNRDGSNDNFSWNCGTEGSTVNLEIELLRKKQIRNFATVLMLSRGIPMILFGDEIRRTQNGNNNSYCQNNGQTYFDWSLVKENSELFHFWKELIRFRKRHPSITSRNYTFEESFNNRGFSHKPVFYGTRLSDVLKAEKYDPSARALAYLRGGMEEESDIYALFNMYWDNLDFEVPAVKGRKWHYAINTSIASIDSIYPEGKEKPLTSKNVSVPARSIIVLISK
ncbi:MAG TPA: glycogen debranching enzyme GlgX [Lentisphaeria bacterium]|nr:MAG: glycogen debranching enzyme GlgX [Lentisphaerae bacterium GWF2_38_69]HBM16733.1 glycogen debranching enzyme GlgX [Lentisphaeria bacterium]